MFGTKITFIHVASEIKIVAVVDGEMEFVGPNKQSTHVRYKEVQSSDISATYVCSKHDCIVISSNSCFIVLFF